MSVVSGQLKKTTQTPVIKPQNKSNVLFQSLIIIQAVFLLLSLLLNVAGYCIRCRSRKLNFVKALLVVLTISIYPQYADTKQTFSRV